MLAILWSPSFCLGRGRVPRALNRCWSYGVDQVPDSFPQPRPALSALTPGFVVLSFFPFFSLPVLAVCFPRILMGTGYFPAPSPFPLSVRFPVLQTCFESRPRAGGKQRLRGLLAASKGLGHPGPMTLPFLTPGLWDSWQVNARHLVLKRQPLKEETQSPDNMAALDHFQPC